MKKILLIFLAAIALAGCEKDFEELNTNPNQPNEVPNTNLLLSAITSGLYETHGQDMSLTYAGLWAQHYAKIQYIDEDKYAYRPSVIDYLWTTLYARPLFDLQDIINNAGDDEPNMKAAAMVMKAYYLSVMTDVWGDIPVSEALQGNEALTPAYDSQDAVYASLLSMLETAAGMFDPAGDDLGIGDIMYNGDVTLWQKLANSLRVRLLVRMSDVDPSSLGTAATILSSEPVFTSNADNAGINFVGDAVNPNPIYENAYVDGRDDHAVSLTLTDLMNAGGFSSVMDPRLPVYANPNDNGDYIGQPNGETEPANFGLVSRIGSAFRDTPNAPVWIMTYAELKLLEAEVNSDVTAFLDGITASHDEHGVSTDGTYMTEASAAFVANMDKAIGEQKWIALFGNGCEAFAEVRRLDYPVLTAGSQTVYPGQGVPLRFPYASTENLTNGTNLSAASNSQGLDASGLFARVWWDVN